MGQNRQQKSTKSWKLENRSRWRSRAQKAEIQVPEEQQVKKQQADGFCRIWKRLEIKTPGVLKGGVSTRVKTCRTGITSKRLLATQAQLFPVDLRDISSLSWNMDAQYLENWNSGFRSRDRGPPKRDTNVSLKLDDEGTTYNFNNEILLTQCTTRSLSPTKSSDSWLQDS